MTKHISFMSTALVMAFAATACRTDDSARADTTLNKDLAMAGNASAQPQLKDSPAARTTSKTTVTTTTTTTSSASKAPAPSRPAPPPPAAAKPAAVTGGSIPGGTSFVIHPSTRICTNTNSIGDRVTAAVAQPVVGANGVTIPTGALVTMTIAQLKRSDNARDAINMTFTPNAVTFGGTTYPLDATITEATIERVSSEPTSKNVQKVATGAVIGAIAGKLIGKSTKATVIGGAAGAAAGAGVAAATQNTEGCIALGSDMTLHLNAPVAIK